MKVEPTGDIQPTHDWLWRPRVQEPFVIRTKGGRYDRRVVVTVIHKEDLREVASQIEVVLRLRNSANSFARRSLFARSSEASTALLRKADELDKRTKDIQKAWGKQGIKVRGL